MSKKCSHYVQIMAQGRLQLTAMALSNHNIAEKPVSPRSALKRRLAGGSWWQNVIDELIASEKADLRELREIRDRTRDLDMMRLLTVLYDRKIERVMELGKLYEYRDNDDGGAT